MAVRTVLSAEALAAALRAFGLPPPDRVVPEPKGAVNTNHHVWAGGRRLFLRLVEAGGEDDVRFEAEVHRRLAAAGYPVAPLLPAADGRPFATVAGKPAMLFAHAEGEELSAAAIDPPRCARVGELLGRLHALAPGLAPARPNPYGLPRVRAWIAALRPDGGGDPEVRAALPVLEDELARAERLPDAPRGLVHGDLFPDNLLWVGERPSCALDWEMACVDALAWDLGVALCAWCWDGGFVAARARALLEGYRAARPLDPATRDALPAFARLVALRFTISRIHGIRFSGLGADRLPQKDWRRFRDRLLALRALGDAGIAALVA